MPEVFPSEEEFLKLCDGYNVIPVYLEVPADLETPISLLYKVFDSESYAFLFESVEGAEKWARFSFLGFKPFLIFKSKNNKVQILKKEKCEEVTCENPFDFLRDLFKEYRTPQIKELPRFWGGAVGFAGYEMINFFEPRVPRGKDTLGFYDTHFMFPEFLIIYDRLFHSIKVVKIVLVDGDAGTLYQEAREKLLDLYSKLRSTLPSVRVSLKKDIFFSPEIEKSEFVKMVKSAKEYIAQGDVIQVVLSQRFSLEDEIFEDPHTGILLYRALRKINPSPYLFYLKLDDEVLIGSSPEILVRLEEGIVETRPIAGTRPRGKTPEEDLAFEEDLKKDEKELAEHIMLVDLGRNDIGRICEYGSVEVYELMVVERYSHVMHLVSGVRGRLAKGRDMFETFSAVFPAGTVSGAPKIRAMEIITELEKTVRGPYAGAVGYFGFSGNMDFCITIRTLFQKGKKLYLQAGAGIVADSVPEREYQETLNKAKGMEKALELFRRGYFL